MKQNLKLMVGIVVLIATMGSANADVEISAQEVMRKTTEQVLAVLRKDGDKLKTDSGRLYQMINNLIVPHFDFRGMSQWVLGRHWRKASKSQKQALTKQFKGLLVRTYGQALLDYRSQKIEFLPMKPVTGELTEVRTRIAQDSGPGTIVTYKMSKQGGDWKVFDVSMEGISLVTIYRASFNQEIKRHGIDGLIKRLSEHNSK